MILLENPTVATVVKVSKERTAIQSDYLPRYTQIWFATMNGLLEQFYATVKGGWHWMITRYIGVQPKRDETGT